MNQTWTAADDAQLVKLISRHLSPQAIAEAMGRTRNAICGRAHRMKLHFDSKRGKPESKPAKRRKPTKQREIARFTAEEDQTIREMAAARKSGLDISEAIKRSKSSVVQRARRLGTPLRGKDGPRQSAEPKAPKVKSDKRRFHPGNIAGKKESRTHDPVFKHVTPAVSLQPLMVPLVDLRPNMCRFPVGDPRDEGFGFCGHPMVDRAYCQAHRRLCYTAPEDRRRAA